ncbi:MAG: hypothetical protein WCA89_08375 [Terracidiphilus sp.]|jgi:hypothetical protein
MHGENQSDFGETEARLIFNAGWRQGSIFRPPEGFVPVRFERDREVLVVCTQSCTVVSERIEIDPHIEFLVAEPVKKFNPRSAEATGKNLRCFHLPISGMPNAEALACDINRRFFVHRKTCLKHSPDVSVGVLEVSARNFATWIARYYTRTALPDELTRRVRKGLYKYIKNALEEKSATGEKLLNSIDKIYINWDPNFDLQGGLYRVHILFLCADADADIRLGSLLELPLCPFTLCEGHDGIKLEYENKVRSETFVSELDGYKRLSEWDYLSNLGDVAEDEG